MTKFLLQLLLGIYLVVLMLGDLLLFVNLLYQLPYLTINLAAGGWIALLVANGWGLLALLVVIIADNID